VTLVDAVAADGEEKRLLGDRGAVFAMRAGHARGRRRVLTGHVVRHDPEAVVGDDLAEHDVRGAGHLGGHPEVGVGGDGELTAEHRLVELQGFAGLSVEVQVGDSV